MGRLVDSGIVIIMRKYLISILFFVFLSCQNSAVINTEDAVILLNNNDYYFLDVRTPIEHKEKSIPATQCIPVNEIEQRLGELEPYRNKKIIVYCRSGNRSIRATEILIESGFDAINLLGGMNHWKGEIVLGK